MVDVAFKTVGDFNKQFKNCSGFKKYTKKNSNYFVINKELSEMFSSSGAGNVDLTGYDNKKFSTSFPAWRNKIPTPPTGGYISFGITQEGGNGRDNFDKVSVYCTANTHNSQSTNFLFKYVYGVDREDKKPCFVEIGFPENVKKNHTIDISEAVCKAGSFWFENGFKSIFKNLTPDICKETATDYRITSKGLFIIKDDKPLTWLCDKGYGCTV